VNFRKIFDGGLNFNDEMFLRVAVFLMRLFPVGMT